MPSIAATTRVRLLWAGFAFLYLLIALWVITAVPPAIGDESYVIPRRAESGVWKAVFGLIAVAALCGLAGTRPNSIGRPVFYCLSALALAAFWMVEPRYVLIPLSLWFAFRERCGTQIEGPTTALWVALAGCLGFGAFSGTFLP